MEITKQMIEEFKSKADRPKASDSDVTKLLQACGGDIDTAVNLIKTGGR